PPLGPEQVGLPGRVEARVVDGLRGVKAGDRTYGQGSVLALTAPVDARASGGGGQCLAGHTIAHGACLIDACRSVAQIQVLCQRRGHQAIEDGIVQCRPPLAQVCGLGFACQRQGPAAADVDRRRLAVVGAHACAGSQQHAGQGQRERTRAPRGQAGDGCAKKGSAGLGFHCRRPRTNTVAIVSVARAMTASGHRLARMSPGGMALRKLPSTMMRKWVSGMAWASHCRTTGMFSTGVAKPDISTAGTPMANAPRMACCCVMLTAEIIRPMPTTDRMNSTRLASRSANEPVNGMPNRNTPALIMNRP